MESKLLSTVNVIEMIDDSIVGMASYADNKEGNALAEKRFTDLIVENGCEETLDDNLENGCCEDGTWKVLLVHSTVS